ncbi:hypothetical protein FYJ74_02805 [Pyramidobacter sp. SM-530-WT-4B]|uniref:Uncharacterized protein n=1 Tax=Pyramidobacter porci TaxID=2605789 RepID=A0A6L5Y9W7_9BACT|nr:MULTISPECIES: hypothetical protein [Pyramidobacter]MCI6261608.1 hypothetical protein [Pyramidobacter sp.]MST54981.1 hypothetical protein [Pyramidobacter porci]BDF78033.1 hypothetical protein CE91St28_08270 [Pyramidobacter piscolens]
MSELKLTVTDRAMERMFAMGREFTIAVTQLNTRSGPMPAAVCRFGAPGAETRGNYARLTQGELTVWAPLAESFINDEVIVDLCGVANMVLPVALTAILTPACNGGCAHCAAGCTSRREDDEEF